MEISSSQAGVVKELKVALGDKVKEGSVMLMLEAAGAATAPILEKNQAAAPVELANAATENVAVAVPPPPHLHAPALPVPWTWIATCLCWALDLVATVPPSARRTLASKSSRSNAMPSSAASA